MKTKSIIRICLLLAAFALMFTNSCKKDNKSNPTAPVLTTSAVSNISSTKANCGGNITDDGGADITARGICWSTAQNPSLSDSKTSDGTGTGIFTSTVTGLTLGTTYYVRAYAINSAGTSFGDQTSFTAVRGVGDSYQGGIIAYVFQPGDPGYIAGELHGIIASTSDQSTGIQWYNGSYVATGATSAASGNTNTNTIVSVQGSGNYAAKLCYDLVLNGYSDWYLPSKAELTKLFLNRAAIGGMPSAYYWSSTEYAQSSQGNAWCYVTNGGGYPNYANKMDTYAVRAVRTY